MNVMLLQYDAQNGRALIRDRESDSCYYVEGPPGMETPVFRGLIDQGMVRMWPVSDCPAVTFSDRFREGHAWTLVGIAAFFLFANWAGDRAEDRVRTRIAARRAAKAGAA